MNLWHKVQNSGLKEIILCCCFFLEVLNLPGHFFLCGKLSQVPAFWFCARGHCPVVGCWAPTSDYAGPELWEQAGGQRAPQVFEWPSPTDVPGEKMFLKPLSF